MNVFPFRITDNLPRLAIRLIQPGHDLCKFFDSEVGKLEIGLVGGDVSNYVPLLYLTFDKLDVFFDI